MSEIDYSLTLPGGVEEMISAGGILLLSVIIVSAILILKRLKGFFATAILSAVAYVIFVFVFPNFMTTLVSFVPSVDAAFDYNPDTYTIVHYVCVAVGFTVSRVFVCSILKGRYDKRGDIYMAGLGLGIGDAFLYGLSAISYITWCAGINNQGLEKLFAGIPAEQALETYNGISALFISPAILWVLLGASVTIEVIANIALMNIVNGVTKKQLPGVWIAVTGVMQLVLSLSFAFYDTTDITSITLLFGLKVLVGGAIIIFGLRDANGKITYENDVVE